MKRSKLAAICVAAVFAVISVFPVPVLADWAYPPEALIQAKGTVAPGGTTELTGLVANPEKGVEYTYAWSCDGGRLSSATGTHVTLTAPSGGASVRVTLRASGGQDELEFTKTIYLADDPDKLMVVISGLVTEPLEAGRTRVFVADVANPEPGVEYEFVWTFSSGRIDSRVDADTSSTIWYEAPTSGKSVTLRVSAAGNGKSANADVRVALRSDGASVAEPTRPGISLLPTAPSNVEVKSLSGTGASVLTGVRVGSKRRNTTVATAVDWISLPSSSSLTVLTADGQAADPASPLATGMVFQICGPTSQVELETTAVVKGDLTGSGILGLSQLVRLASGLMGEPLEGVWLTAGDLNESGSIDLADLVQLAALVMSGENEPSPGPTATPVPTQAPTGTPNPTAAPSASFPAEPSWLAGFRREATERMNAVRAGRGWKPLSESEGLNAVAQVRAVEMAATETVSNFRPDGSSFVMSAHLGGDSLPVWVSYLDALRASDPEQLIERCTREVWSGGDPNFDDLGTGFAQGSDGLWYVAAVLCSTGDVLWVDDPQVPPHASPTPTNMPDPTAAPVPTPTAAPTEPAPAPTVSHVPTLDDIRQDVLDQTNAMRAEGGLAPVQMIDGLNMAAQVRAEEMANALMEGHYRPNGDFYNTVFAMSDSTLSAENACTVTGYSTAQGAADGMVGAWKRSQGHYEQIMDDRYAYMGFGIARGSDGRWYGYELFTRSPNVTFVDAPRV